MNELINIGFGIEATVAATILFILKGIALFFALTYTVITLRNLAELAGSEAANRPWLWKRGATLNPVIIWMIFILLTQIPV